MFFSFDGLDGAGKSTQIERFVAWLEGRGHTVLVCRDPGSTELSERIRDLLLTRDSLTIGMRSEALLYMAARAELVEQQIVPALAANQTIVSDRFLLANLVYQGHAGGLPLEDLRAIGGFTTGGVSPDLTFLLDLPPELSFERLGREPDRIEQRGLAYLRKVRFGFLDEAARDPDHIRVIDATGSVDEMHEAIVEAAGRVLHVTPGGGSS